MQRNQVERSRALVRISGIIGNPRTGERGLLPIGRTSWYNGIASGRFPQPIKIGPRMSAWRLADIEDLIERFERGDRSASLARSPLPAREV